MIVSLGPRVAYANLLKLTNSARQVVAQWGTVSSLNLALNELHLLSALLQACGSGLDMLRSFDALNGVQKVSDAVYKSALTACMRVRLAWTC